MMNEVDLELRYNRKFFFFRELNFSDWRKR